MPSKPPILLIGDAVAPTGFARVLRNVFERLSGDFEIHQLATRCREAPVSYPWKLYPAGLHGDVYGENRIAELVDRIHPRLVFILYDIPFQGRYLKALREAGSDAKVVSYSPVDAGPVVPELIQRLQGISRCVLFTEYGKSEIERAVADLRVAQPGFSFSPLAVIPQGIDTDIFHPLAGAESRRLARRRLFPDTPEMQDAFIVLNANRNQRRKRIDLTMEGFAAFAAGKPENVKLFLHMALEGDGWHLPTLARRFGIEERLILTTGEDAHPTVADTQLNAIYNACDVGVNTASAEGWGLVSFEHGATRAAQIVPCHTSQAELWRGAAELLPPVMTVTEPGDLIHAHLLSAADLASSLEWLYRDEEHRDRMAQAAWENAHRPEYRWESITGRWRHLLNEVLGE